MLSKSTILNLNRDCFCFPVDRAAVNLGLKQSVPIAASQCESRENLFAATGVMLDTADIDAMLTVIEAIETLTQSDSYHAEKISQCPDLEPWKNKAGDGMIMGYDFHIGEHRPQLIEVNTNAGGAFIVNELLSITDKLYPPCCGFGSLELNGALLKTSLQKEWQSAGRQGSPDTVAIVDDDPVLQYLYPDMQIAQRYFQKAGLKTVVADVSQLSFDGNALLFEGSAIDIVYNRSTDFLLNDKTSAVLADAALSGAAIVAPNPWHHGLYANKRNFIDFTDTASLKRYGMTESHTASLLAHVPETTLVTRENAEELHRRRKKLFFKPVDGFGSRAVYRGDKLTKRVWQEILQHTHSGKNYIAQKMVPPSLRAVTATGSRERLKFDVRIYTAGGVPLIAAARIYQGQTTNFRTAGGGFAPVYSWSGDAGMSANDCHLASSFG